MIARADLWGRHERASRGLVLPRGAGPLELLECRAVATAGEPGLFSGDAPPPKRGRGRPKLTDEQRRARQLERLEESGRQLPPAEATFRPARPPSNREIERCAREEIPGFDPFTQGAKGFRFDLKLARKAVRFFFRQLSHVDGRWSGKPFKLTPWQIGATANLFGWVHAKTGRRRFRECFLTVARKNGKTTWAAGVAALMLFEDGEQGAGCYTGANDALQASISWEAVRAMVWNNPDLSSRCRIYTGAPKAIQLGPESGFATFRTVTGKADAQHGLKVHFGLIDELHVQGNRDLVDVLQTGTASRDQPLILYTTTADYARQSICNELHDYAESVRDGLIEDPSFLPIVFSAPIDADWESIDTWRMGNPNLDVTVDRAYLARELEKAKRKPSYENTFRRLHLNQRTEQAVRWLPMADWDQCAGLQLEQLRGLACYGGLDLSQTRDITSFGLWFPEISAVLVHHWIPEGTLREREKRDRFQWAEWVAAGLVRTTPGNTIDYELVRADVVELSERYGFRDIAIDPWNANETSKRLEADDGFNVTKVRQGFQSLSAPSKELERLVVDHKLRHTGCPVLRWMAGNCAVELDKNGNIRPLKDPQRPAEKIDGIVTIIMAIGCTLHAEGDRESVYETKDLVVL